MLTFSDLNYSLRIARSVVVVPRVTRLACGYVVTRSLVEFTDADRAWFKRPVV